MDAYLTLEHGEILKGRHIGYQKETEGEVVFTTAMTGYPESLTDPSFAGQILVFTYPLLGNYGVPQKKFHRPHLLSNFESDRIWVRGVVLSELCDNRFDRGQYQTLDAWLMHEKISGICDIDTRALTQKIREHGVVWGVITTKKPSGALPIPKMLRRVVSDVSTPRVISYKPDHPNGKSIALIDCGVKHGIIRALLGLGYRITRIPWNEHPLSHGKFDGVVCSNGPGDPKDCPETVENIKNVLKSNIPFLGICLGHQLLALAVGADTYKLPYGHRGLNQPCQDRFTGRAYITSQNHGYAVDRRTLPSDYREWFTNLNDDTVEGICHRIKNIKSVQFHPEGCPGPFDTNWIYRMV
ncbi:MAG: glutamine-hydrolyzing carbamoyl-phosphate synthase small subunit [bacterium]|nr:glutamine-hydrolyzing carbamoyl-phosphate synthase small subunit [bacterium]